MDKDTALSTLRSPFALGLCKEVFECILKGKKQKICFDHHEQGLLQFPLQNLLCHLTVSPGLLLQELSWVTLYPCVPERRGTRRSSFCVSSTFTHRRDFTHQPGLLPSTNLCAGVIPSSSSPMDICKDKMSSVLSFSSVLLILKKRNIVIQ